MLQSGQVTQHDGTLYNICGSKWHINSIYNPPDSWHWKAKPALRNALFDDMHNQDFEEPGNISNLDGGCMCE